VRQQIAFYASTRTYEPVLASHGWQDLAKSLHRKSVEGDWGGAWPSSSPTRMVDTYAVTGTWDTIGAKIPRALRRAPRSHLVLPAVPAGLDDPRLPRVVKEFNG